ncbi:DeoR/GlpR family DNA-binding transcription regulator [Breoghania sp.]|uniref:DeoR/GlpR family DNA-binding transcription regulator n=1 Tax=Breoghania sp. TaxID=2065378 RepID=UPI0029CA17B8|nr:DeoR/GlpR family DNA-binding transcription regulator [Breoghania sp.]
MSITEKTRSPAQVRMNEILKRLHEGGAITVAEIARDFGISDMTVRRDLSELEKEGLLERVHGGAIPPAGGPLRVIDDVEPTFKARLDHNVDIKARIARKAVDVIAPFRTIAMDVGTSTLLVAQILAKSADHLHRKRIFTNSLRVAETLAETVAEVYVPGGRVRGDEMSMTGPAAVEQFSRYRYDVAVLGTAGMTVEGFFDYSLEEVELKRVYLERAAHRVVLCDSSKFRRMSTAHVASLREANVLITDAPPPTDIASALASAKVDVQIAGL